MAAGYFGTCGTWPGGRSRAGHLEGDAGPAQRSQVDAIGTAIENTTPGSRHLREAVGERQSISRACSLLGQTSPHPHSSRSRSCMRMRLGMRYTLTNTTVLHNQRPQQYYTAPPTVDGLFWNSILNWHRQGPSHNRATPHPILEGRLCPKPRVIKHDMGLSVTRSRPCRSRAVVLMTTTP